jgi:hypothetical protein
MAQAAHAATAVLHENAELQSVRDYLSDLPNMRKTIMEVSYTPGLSTTLIDYRSPTKPS